MIIDEPAQARSGLGYAVNAQYYDLIFPREVRGLEIAALERLLPGARTVVEIGAGTGAITAAIVDLLPDGGEVFAIEPTAVMRVALATRLAAMTAAEDRATILTDDAFTAKVDGPVDAVVMFHVLTHFAPADRRRLWTRWAGRLAPSGVIVTESQYPQRAAEVAETVVPGRRLGRRRYDTVTRADVIDGERIRWTMTYRVHEGDRLLWTDVADFESYVVSDAELDTELAVVGCSRIPELPDGILAWRAPGLR